MGDGGEYLLINECMAKDGKKTVKRDDVLLGKLDLVMDEIRNLKAEMRAVKAGLSVVESDLSTVKVDLNAVKVDLSTVKENIRLNMYTRKEHEKFVADLMTVFPTRCEFEEFKETMYAKHGELMNYMDAMMKEVLAVRDERVLNNKTLTRMDDQIFDHDKRIKVLEKRGA